MINSYSLKYSNENQSNERGAALVSALLITALLLGICGVLLMTASSTAVNAFDSTAEMQAYYAAETGLQATLDVLRGNVAPRTAGSTEKMSFATAVTPSRSNRAGDAASSGSNAYARLSEWLPYNSSFDPIPLSNGTAYSVRILNAEELPLTLKPEPNRVLVQVTGYGPKNAVKKMEMVVTKSFLGSFSSPGTVLVNGSTQTPTNAATISAGSSSALTVTGQDQAKPLSTPYPSIAVTTTTDLTVATAATLGKPVTPAPKLLTTSQIPYFLQSPDSARTTLNDLQEVAQLTNRYFTPSSPPPDLGSPTQPKMTFIDGDFSVSQSSGTGAGLLVVTGTLTFDGNYSFQGLILVLGTGNMQRSGGGGGEIAGSIIVAKFDRYNYGAPFLAPTFDTSGGGNSTVAYNSDYINRAIGMTVRRPIGIVERGVVNW